MPKMRIGNTEIKYKSLVKCDICITDDADGGAFYFVRDVNIDDRIIVSSGVVKELSLNIYLITPYSSLKNELKSINKLKLLKNGIDYNQKIETVKAIVDSVEYEGNEILVDGVHVIVNGKLMSKNRRNLENIFILDCDLANTLSRLSFFAVTEAEGQNHTIPVDRLFLERAP